MIGDFLFGRIFFDEPASTSSENALVDVDFRELDFHGVLLALIVEKSEHSDPDEE